MPRPRPPEKLRAYSVRLTQRQWAKVQELGGALFLRKLIAEHKPVRGRSFEHIKWIKARNAAICAHLGTCVEVAELYHLSPSRVSHIRKQYRRPE